MTHKTKWVVDATHSEIGFKVRHLMIAHTKGFFKTFDANIYTTEKDFTKAEIDLWIDVASIYTGDEKRDEHLKSADFFDVKQHKQITFTCTSIEKAHEGKTHDMWGELTMKGIMKVIKLNVEFGGIVKDHNGNEKAGFTVKGKINRKDWGLEWNKTIETGGIMVGEDITIMCELELDVATEKDSTIVLDKTEQEQAVF
jgi:polyisoprenoid-binding protein YceI